MVLFQTLEVSELFEGLRAVCNRVSELLGTLKVYMLDTLGALVAVGAVSFLVPVIVIHDTHTFSAIYCTQNLILFTSNQTKHKMHETHTFDFLLLDYELTPWFNLDDLVLLLQA